MPADVVKFGNGLELDEGAYELRRSGRALKLERIPLDLLFLLVERRGQLVTREDIIARIWGKDIYLDTDSSINGAIRKIRQVLKDDPENPIFVQTVTGKGYRFVATVTAGVPIKQQEDTGKSAVKAQALESDVIARGRIEKPVGQDGTAEFAQDPSKRSSWKMRWMVPSASLLLLLAAG